jgi:hypothetical protein
MVCEEEMSVQSGVDGGERLNFKGKAIFHRVKTAFAP